MIFDAVITAGGRIDGGFSALAGTSTKALAPVGGKTMLLRTIEAARDAGARAIAVVGGDEVREACDAVVDCVIPEGGSGEENVTLALGAWAGSALLYLASDMPFIGAPALTEFLSMIPGDAVAMPLADAKTYEAMFPDAPAHAIAFRGERVVNSSVFYLPAGSAQRVEPVARSLFAARKSALKMALLLGPSVVLRFATGRLQIMDLERRGRELAGSDVRAVRNCGPSLCFDVDSLADYEYACART